MIEAPRNVLISDVEFNYVRVDSPVKNPFGGPDAYEMQIATTDAAKAQEMRDAFLNVKEKDGKFVASLKRKAARADGSDNGKVRVVDANKAPFEAVRTIGNGSRGNVIVWQAPYDTMGRKGVSSSLTAIQVTDLEVYTPQASVDFDVVGGSEETPSADLF